MQKLVHFGVKINFLDSASRADPKLTPPYHSASRRADGLDHPTPGSPEAMARGCTCDPVKNRDGAGEVEGTVFHTDWGCLLHGRVVIVRAGG